VRGEKSHYIVFLLCKLNGLVILMVDTNSWTFERYMPDEIKTTGGILMDFQFNTLFLVFQKYGIYTIEEHWVDLPMKSMELMKTDVSYGDIVDIKIGKEFVIINRVDTN
jgi:hypothetical protein